jgi:hypothetical protein
MKGFLNEIVTALLITSISHAFRPLHRAFKGSRAIQNAVSMSGATNQGLVLTINDISSPGRDYVNLGMPRVLPPGQVGEDWLLWLHARDSKLADDVVKLSTGRILFASSKDGLSGWKFHEDSPVLNPNKENDGDWYFFDSEHVGLGDVIQPGEKANEKFATQVGDTKMTRLPTSRFRLSQYSCPSRFTYLCLWHAHFWANPLMLRTEYFSCIYSVDAPTRLQLMVGFRL